MIKRVVVAGGGTGGHLFPGIAVVEELRRRVPELDVLFVGTPRGIESRVVPRMGERLELLDVRPLRGGGASGFMRGASVLPGAIARATSLLAREQPDLVLGVGGYAAGPVLAAAGVLGVPAAVLEQNADVGMTNRLLAPFAGRAYVTFPETARRFPHARVRIVGNPVRRAFVDAARHAMVDPAGFEARSRTVLVIGGSQGARTLNRSIPEALAQAGVERHGLEVVHQSGAPMQEEVEARYRELGMQATVVPFIDDMARAYAQSAVVIARAGATTVAELCAIGRPSLLIPYPYAAGDHQRKNAEALERAGAARCLPDDEASAERASAVLAPLLTDAAQRRRMADAARRFGRPDAAAAVVDDVCDWLGCPPRHQVGAREPGGGGASEPTRDDEQGGGPSAARVALRGERPYVPQWRCSTFPPQRDGTVGVRTSRRRLVAHPSLLES